MTTIYHYHPTTSEYRNETTASLDPLEKKPMIPAHATTKKPPATKENEAAIFENDSWQIVPDYRGVEYWLPDGSVYEILELSQELPPEALSEKPAPTAEELAAIEEQERQAAIKKQKLDGVEFDGVMCSATFRDQSGLLAAMQWVKAGGSTVFIFENDNKLEITPANIEAFYSVWAPFRAGFFK